MAPPLLLSAMTTETVCERMQKMEGLDPSMVQQYSATIRKANINGRVLSQCNVDELKKEMSMNFGDWQLFRAAVLEMRRAEGLREEVGSEAGSVAVDTVRVAPPLAGSGFGFNLSFDELSTVGLDEQRPPWNVTMGPPESPESGDIWRLTDRQQAEYRNAYQDYITHMSSLDQDQNRTDPDRAEPDRRALKRNSVKLPEEADVLHPIREDHEEEEPGTSAKDRTADRPRSGQYQKLSDEDSEALDKKDSSDSGVRSNESSPNHSLQEEDQTRTKPVQVQDGRMSICSDQGSVGPSLWESSPEEALNNLNTAKTQQTQQTGTNQSQSLNNNSPGPAQTSTQNENVRVLHLKRGLNPGDPPEVCTVSRETVCFSAERESIL